MIKHLLLSIFFLLPTWVLCQRQELLTIQNDSAEIVLESMNVHVRIIGNIATTVTEMTFYNPNDRVLEGELNFPLAENQRVYRFALDFNGMLREGVAVEKNLGRRAFEGVVRQNIDPALLEMTAGNNYKARIYPIPAKGTRKILIGVEEELQYSEMPLYQLAMNYGKIGNFYIKVELMDQAVKPKIKRNDLVNFNFEQWRQGFIAEHSASDFEAAGVLSFEIPTKLVDAVYRERQPQTDYFYLLVNPPQTSIAKKKPATVAIIWDASNSAKNRDLSTEKELLRAYFEKFDHVEVTILQFSDELLDTAKVKVQHGNSSEVIAILDRVVYDGGTNLQKIDFGQLKFDEIMLFSDGISNLGKLTIDKEVPPVYTVCSSSVADLSLLKYLASRTGGSFVNLVNTSLNDALRQLNAESLQFLGANYNERKISDVYPSRPRSIDANTSFTVSGKIKTNKKTSITLKFGIRGQVLETREIQIDNTLLGSSLPRLWAHKKVDELIMGPDDNRDAIIAIGKQYGLVTPHTSLIVLDRVEDYVEYGILPPAELKEEYDRIISEKTEALQLRDAEIIEWMLIDFEDRVDWWKDNMKDSTQHVPQENERRPGQSTETQPGDTQSPDSEEEDTRLSAAEDQIEEEDATDDTTQESEPDNNPVVSNPIEAGEYDQVVAGKITSAEDGRALPGVNVIVKGTQRGTISDIDGNYQIAVNNDETLFVSFIGYSTQEIEVGGRTEIDVALSEDVQQLSEVVVTAMGVEVSRQSLSYSISTATTALAGQVAGVNISDATGGTVVVRGNSAIKIGDEPMYLIDGELASKADFEALDLDEVGSMNVIKGENATSLYGSQAADGVIVIMTKDALDDALVLPDSVSSHFEQTW